MAQYIDKATLVAEIDKIIADETESIKSFEHSKNASEVQRSNARIGVLIHIRSLLDTLDVKEVDLEKALESWRHNHFQGRRDKDAGGEYLERISQLELAKYFFELGLKAQKG